MFAQIDCHLIFLYLEEGFVVAVVVVVIMIFLFYYFILLMFFILVVDQQQNIYFLLFLGLFQSRKNNNSPFGCETIFRKRGFPLLFFFLLASLSFLFLSLFLFKPFCSFSTLFLFYLQETNKEIQKVRMKYEANKRENQSSK